MTLPSAWTRRWHSWLRLCIDTHLELPVFALILVAVIWSLALQTIRSEHGVALATARDSIHELADTYASHVTRNSAMIEQTLKVARYAVQLNGAAGALPALKAADLLPPGLVFLVAIFDQNGMLVASNPPAAERSIAHHAYFQSQRNRDSSTVIVSAPLIEKAGDEPALHFSRRIVDAAGKFAGVVVVQVEPSYFTSDYEHSRMGKHGLIGLFGEDGALRTLRVGDRTTWGDVRLSDAIGTPSWDHVERMSARHELHGIGLTGVVAVAIDEQLAGYFLNRREILWQTGIVSIVIVLSTALAWLWLWQNGQMRRSARRLKETYAAAAEANVDAFYVLRIVRDSAGKIVDFRIAATNSRAEQMQNLSKQHMLGLRLSEMLPGLYTNGIFDSLVQVAESRGTFDEERENKDMPNVAARWVHLQLVGVEDGVVAIIRDVSERKQTEARILHMAQHDALTNLPNRSLLKELLTAAIARAEGEDDGAVLVGFIDLDGFKMINDGLGHNAGDELLQKVTRRMQTCLRQHHCVGRFGGDEFVLVLPWRASQLDDAKHLLEQIRTEIARPITLGSQDVRISCSIGVAIYPEHGEDAESLLIKADLAMYRAKEAGKNKYQFYDEEMHASILSKLSLLEDMRYGLDHGQFRVLYQPKVSLHDGHLFGVEALVRWHHPVQGIISPVLFIPLAEESGLIVALGEWVLRTACAQNRAWRDAGLAPISMAVNVSARQFDDTELVAKVRQALDDSELDASGLELEVTESLIMRDMAMSVAKMHALTAMGLSLSIDDFGTGYSSLSSLKTYPVSTLKIDKSFVSDLSTNPDDQAIARAIIALAHQLNLRVIAEGVETQEQRAFLVENGCDEMQGYLYSRPVVAAEIQLLLEQEGMNQAHLFERDTAVAPLRIR